MRALEARGLLDRALEALPSDDGAAGARARRARPDAAGAGRAAELRQDRPVARPARQRRARRAAARALARSAISRPRCASALPATSRSTACGARSSRSGSPTPSSTAAGRPWRCGWRTRRGARTADVAHAFLATREVFELPALWQRIDALDGKVDGRGAAGALPGDAGPGERADAAGSCATARRSPISPAPSPGTGEGSPRCGPALADVLPARRKAQLEAETQPARRGRRAGRPGRRCRRARRAGPGAGHHRDRRGDGHAGAGRGARLTSRSASICASRDLAAKAGAIGDARLPTTGWPSAQALSQLARRPGRLHARRHPRRRRRERVEAWLARQGAGSAGSRRRWRRSRGEGTLTVVAAAGGGRPAQRACGATRPLPQHQPGRAEQAGRSRSAVQRKPARS